MPFNSRTERLPVSATCRAESDKEIVVAGVLWDNVSHAAVFYYGAIFAIAGIVGLLFISGKRNRPTVDA